MGPWPRLPKNQQTHCDPQPWLSQNQRTDLRTYIERPVLCELFQGFFESFHQKTLGTYGYFFSILKRKTWNQDNNIHGYNYEIHEVKENSPSALHQNEAKADIVHHTIKGTLNALQGGVSHWGLAIYILKVS